MKMKFISQSKSFYGFCLIKVYKFTFRSCESIVYTVKSTKYKVRSLFTDPLFPERLLLGILGGGVPPSSPIPDPISEQRI